MNLVVLLGLLGGGGGCGLVLRGARDNLAHGGDGGGTAVELEQLGDWNYWEGKRDRIKERQTNQTSVETTIETVNVKAAVDCETL